jgi:hypothetical protein
MLLSMFLISSEHMKSKQLLAAGDSKSRSLEPLTKQRNIHYRKNVKRRAKVSKRGQYEKWVKLREKLKEADINRKFNIKTIAQFLQQVLPGTSPHTRTKSFQNPKSRVITHRKSTLPYVGSTVVSLSKDDEAEYIYETPKKNYRRG